MNSNRFWVITVVFVTFVMLAPVSRVWSQGGNYSCDGHSTHWHKHDGDGYWKKWWKITSWEPEYVIAEIPTTKNDEWVRLVDRVFTNHDCSTATASVNVTTTVTHTVTVTGGWEFGGKLSWAAGALFAKCEAEAHAKVNRNDSCSDTQTETIAIGSSKEVGSCHQVKYWYDKFKRDRGYEIEAADAKFVCEDHYSGNTVTDYCNRGILVGNGTGWDEVQDGWAFVKKVCTCENGIPVPINEPVPQTNGNIPPPSNASQSGG